jgi:DNA-binding transcriptional LysR family regulator
METHEIRYFLAMVRELNFTRAADSCGVTQPALTRAIQKLEAELGGALFLRRPGQIELTRLAREVLPRLAAIERSMMDVHAQAAAVARSQQHSIRLGVMCTVGPAHVVALIERLKEQMPELEISITDAKSADIVNLIAQDEIDIGIAAWPQYPDTVRVDPLLVERYAVAMRSGDPLGVCDRVELERLAGQSYIQRLGCEFDDHYAVAHGEWSIELDIAFASEREDWIHGMLAAGFGYAIVPEFMELPAGLVKRVLCQPEIVREVSLLTLRGKRMPTAVAAFAQIAKSHKWNITK